jgi:hypothetical protein
MIKYELVVIWDSGEKDVYDYETYEAAKRGEASMRMIFGCQIAWTGINERRF